VLWSFSIFYIVQFSVFYVHLVYFSDIWYIFPVFLRCNKKTLATLIALDYRGRRRGLTRAQIRKGFCGDH
jgi:hypothetical protein